MMLHLIATGGTIASLADPRTGVVRPAVGARELLAGVPGLAAVGPIESEEVERVSGWDVTPPIMLEVAQRADAALAEDRVAGVLVTHGTDTVEETAFLCDLVVSSDKPVVFAAAMRSGDQDDADGPRNLLDAARVAGDPAARGRGALLALHGEVHAARWVRKLHSERLDAFASPGHGPVGLMAGGAVRFVAGPAPVRHVLPRPGAFDREVALLQTTTGMPERLIDAVLDATDAAGLVLEGTGNGNVPGSALASVERALARALPVVIAARAPEGGTAPVYGGPGGGATLRDLGVLEAGGLSAAKARLLLMLLLAAPEGPAGLPERFRAAVAALA